MPKGSLILIALILAGLAAWNWMIFRPQVSNFSPEERNAHNQWEMMAAYDRQVLDYGSLPTGEVKTYLPDGRLPTNPWSQKPVKVVSPGEEYGPGDFMLVPADMTLTIYSYEGQERKLEREEEMQGYWLISFGDKPLDDLEGYMSMLDEDWEFIKETGLKNVVALLRISDTDMPGGYRVELEKFPSAWAKATSEKSL